MATFFGNLLAWSLQVTVVVAAAAAVARIVAIDAPGVRHAWWRGVLALCLTLPLLQPWQRAPAPVVSYPSMADVASIAPGRAARNAALSGPGLSSPTTSPGSLETVAAVALAAGVLLRLIWLAAGLARLRRLRRAGTTAAAATAGRRGRRSAIAARRSAMSLPWGSR